MLGQHRSDTPRSLSMSQRQEYGSMAQAHGARSQHSHRSGEGDKGRLASEAALAKRPWQLLDQLLSHNLEPDRYTCSTLVKGLHLPSCSATEIDRAVSFMQKIGPAGLYSSSAGGSGCSDASNARLLEVLFNTLLDARVSIRDLDCMADIFEMMGSSRSNFISILEPYFKKYEDQTFHVTVVIRRCQAVCA